MKSGKTTVQCSRESFASKVLRFERLRLQTRTNVAIIRDKISLINSYKSVVSSTSPLTSAPSEQIFLIRTESA